MADPQVRSSSDDFEHVEAIHDDEDSTDDEREQKSKEEKSSKITHRKVVSREKEGDSMDITRMMKGITGNLHQSAATPQWVKRYIKKAEPMIPIVAQVLRIIAGVTNGIVNAVFPLLTAAKANKFDVYLPAIIGVIMVFYGGSFMFLIAAVEAYRISGWELTEKCLKDLYRNYANAAAADAKDDEDLAQIDENDSRSKEDKMSDEEYLSHKIRLILTVVKPQQVLDAVSGITSGFFAVVATLKMKFAEAVTLGTAMGQMYEKVVKKLFLHDLQLAAGKYKEWVAPCLSYACKIIGISLAYSLQVVAVVAVE